MMLANSEQVMMYNIIYCAVLLSIISPLVKLALTKLPSITLLHSGIPEPCSYTS